MSCLWSRSLNSHVLPTLLSNGTCECVHLSSWNSSFESSASHDTLGNQNVVMSHRYMFRRNHWCRNWLSWVSHMDMLRRNHWCSNRLRWVSSLVRSWSACSLRLCWNCDSRLGRHRLTRHSLGHHRSRHHRLRHHRLRHHSLRHHRLRHNRLSHIGLHRHVNGRCCSCVKLFVSKDDVITTTSKKKTYRSER